MNTIDDQEAIGSWFAVLRRGARSAQFETPMGTMRIEFKSDVAETTDVTATMSGSTIKYEVSERAANLPYVFDGQLNSNGVPTYSISIYVSPIGDIDDSGRARYVALTVARLGPPA